MNKFINFLRTITYLGFILAIVFAVIIIAGNLYNSPDMYSNVFFIAGVIIFISGQLLLFIMQQKQNNDEVNKKMDIIIEFLEKQAIEEKKDTSENSETK
ncbi:MAG: hypothetical protein NC122_07675 [Faecalibacterium sp.]|nr:hypothetical protein [Ruminococcus sp.]MCM1392621.1 hypothetical protein [Ruminococcus sp.]MCM1486072.1 hypothetical protein [Faecalibacterium sp.]